MLLLCLAITQTSTAQLTPEDILLHQVAERENIPVSQLTLLTIESKAYPLLNQIGYRAKILDAATNRLYSAAADSAGNPVKSDSLARQEQALYQAQFGTLHPDLYAQLQTLSAEEMVAVSIWLKAETLEIPARAEVAHEMTTTAAGDAAPPLRTTSTAAPTALQEKPTTAQANLPPISPTYTDIRQQIDTAEATTQQNLAVQIATIQAPLLATLAEHDLQPTTTSTAAPLIHVELPKSTLLEIAQHPTIDTIYPAYTNFDLMDIAKPTQKADVVENWGNEGGAYEVAILEDSRIEFDNPFLDLGGNSESDTVRVPGDSNVDQHATATAGMVASQHGTQEGIAQNADLYSANATTYNDADISDAMDWSVNNNMDIINNSWGGNTGSTNLNVHDRHLDYIVRINADTVVVAAGNEANTCGSQTDRVVSPARAYNVITVGGFNDANTITWDDDTMYFCSSFIDPSTGVEKPEVAASAANIVSTSDNSADWIEDAGSGTSYAAPMVSAEAALLLNQDSALTAYPESVKAIIMATALHNIEGDSELSDQDGAGAVDMRAAAHLADAGWWDWDQVQESGFPYTYTQYAHTGETVRAVIAWNSNPTNDYTSNPLEADLDLRVYEENGDFVTSSTSFDNSYEIVEFEAPSTGYYDFRISEFRFDGSSEYIGFAFWPGYRTLTPYTPDTYDTPPVTFDYYRINTADHWHAAGIRMPSGHDYDISLYDQGAFGDPEDHIWLEDSTLGGDTLDFVVIDGNHAPQEDYFLETETFDGSGGTYNIEWATQTAVATDGSYGPYTMTPTQLLRVWDAPLTNDVEKRMRIQPINGNIDLGLALFETNSSDSASWYQGRSQAVAEVDNNGLDEDEILIYTPTDSDEYGLVAWSNNGTQNSDFMLYIDSTPPTGTIDVANGQTYVQTTAVTITNNVNDNDTPLTEMRFSNDGSTWSSWEAFNSTKSWTLDTGDGSQTVHAQFRNVVSMTTTLTDTIMLDTMAPTTTITSPAETLSQTFTVSWSGNDNLAGVDNYDIQYRVGSTGSWTDWLTATSDTSAVFGAGQPLTVQRDETYHFRVRARDLVGNQSTYTGNNGDTSTYVALFKLYIPMTIR